MNTSERIKYCREKTKMSQEELAFKVGITRNTVISYEKNPKSFKNNILVKIADACKVSDLWLLTGDESQGIFLDKTKVSEPAKDYQVTAEYLSPQIIKLQNAVDKLEKELDSISERMDKREEELTQIISKLIEDNEKWRVLFTKGGGLGPLQSKLNR